MRTPTHRVTPNALPSVIEAAVEARLAAMVPTHETLKAYTLKLAVELGQARWRLVQQSAASAIPGPFLVVLVFWAAVLFASFGLFAPRHAVAVTVLALCALSVAGAVFIVMELGQPFGGFLRIPSGPARTALQNMR